MNRIERLKKHAKTLEFLQKVPAPLRRSILQKASPELIHCICDCAHNILQGNVSISSQQKAKLSKYKTKLRQLTDRKVSQQKKKKLIQTGGFLPLLLGALAPVLGSVIGGLVKR